MVLKVVGGKYRGKKVVLPESMEDFRPTRSRVREALSSSLQPWIADAKVLELCAGSGIFSLEMLSRGATNVIAVEADTMRGNALKKMVEDNDLSNQITAYVMSAEEYLAEPDNEFDIIFFDPPYYEDNLTALIPEVIPLLAPLGVLVFEAASDDMAVLEYKNHPAIDYRVKKYGATTLHFFEKSEE